jgi:hypothetical protein
MLIDVIHVALIVIAGAIIAAVIVVLALRRLLSAKAADGDAAERLRQREADLEALRVRELVEELLEGGRTAFEMRRLKYGF